MFGSESRLQWIERAVAELLRKLVDLTARVVKLEQMPWAISGGGGGGGGTSGDLIPAIVVTAIPQGVGLTPSSTGAVAFYTLATGATVMTTDPLNTNVQTYNWYTNTGTIAVGKHCWVAYRDNVYWFVTSDC